MFKFVSSVCAAAMALSLPLATPAAAAAMPMAAPDWQGVGVIQAQAGEYWRGGQGMGRGDRGGRWDRGLQRRGDHYYYRGHRGSRQYRPGYRRYGDFWFPPAAFIAGAIVGGAIGAQQPPVRYRPVDGHVEWCYNRYRSYRASDNTFQPYNGPRRQCISPYG